MKKDEHESHAACTLFFVLFERYRKPRLKTHEDPRPGLLRTSSPDGFLSCHGLLHPFLTRGIPSRTPTSVGGALGCQTASPSEDVGEASPLHTTGSVDHFGSLGPMECAFSS